jgi:hypothetical protein
MIKMSEAYTVISQTPDMVETFFDVVSDVFGKVIWVGLKAIPAMIGIIPFTAASLLLGPALLIFG